MAEVFLTTKVGDRTLRVIKSYGKREAQTAFDEMDTSARAFLQKSLKIEDLYEDLPTDPFELDDILWEEMLEGGAEDPRLGPGSQMSFFIVRSFEKGKKPQDLFVSPDWPTAEAYVQQIVA